MQETAESVPSPSACLFTESPYPAKRSWPLDPGTSSAARELLPSTPRKPIHLSVPSDPSLDQRGRFSRWSDLSVAQGSLYRRNLSQRKFGPVHCLVHPTSEKATFQIFACWDECVQKAVQPWLSPKRALANRLPCLLGADVQKCHSCRTWLL